MAVKILSVDDEMDLELLLTQYFRRKIRKGEYEFIFAHNGIEALSLLLKNPDVSIILSDINMPEMDGLTLLAKINEMRNPALKCIMVSAYGDMGNIRHAMNNGAFDFATKPIDLDDLSLTIEKAVEQIAYIRQSQQEHKQLVSLKNDLAVASEIQQAILPRVFPPFVECEHLIDIAASMTPAKDVGGDFYDFFRIDDDHIGFVIADVSGKGIPAAIFMAVSRTFMRAIGIKGDTPADCLKYVNNLLARESVESMFVTVFYAIYELSTGKVRYANAGHNPPCLLKSSGSVEEVNCMPHLMLGIMEDIEYVNQEFQMETGDTLVFYTDGVTEAFNEHDEAYDDKRLNAVLPTLNGKSSRELIDGVLSDVQAFVGSAPQSDDITLMAIRRKS